MPREEMVSISGGNIKMGKISSVSLPAIVTCRKDCECCKKCYAAKIERLRKMVKVAYQRNWKILQMIRLFTGDRLKLRLCCKDTSVSMCRETFQARSI